MPTVESDYSNKIFDYEHVAIQVPDRADITTSPDPEVYLKRINELSSPTDRLATLVKSTLNPFTHPTHEAKLIRMMTITGAFGGMIVGGIFRSKGIHAQYIRLHNASVFESSYRGNRHFYDTLLLGIFRKGIKYCVGCSLLCASAGFIGLGSIVYRQKLYLPDFIIGSAIVAGSTRLWLGPRAVLVGAGIGAVGGMFGYSLVRAIELATGRPITHMAYLEQEMYLEAREDRRIRLIKAREKFMIEKFSKGDL